MNNDKNIILDDILEDIEDIELEDVNGGEEVNLNSSEVSLHNMPKINPDEKYVMTIDFDDVDVDN